MRGSIAFPSSDITIFNTDDATNNTKPSIKSKLLLLTLFDTLFSFFVVCPCVVGYWRSVWTLMDIYVLPDNALISAIVSTLLGIFGHLFFAVFQRFFANNLHPDRSRILFYVISRIYTVCFGFVCVNGWRGPWAILTIQTKTELRSVIVTTTIGLVALISIRALRNVSAPPCIIVNDVVKGYFEVMTMFRVSIAENTSLYIMDCLFSVLVVGTLVVFVWRGLWVIVDIFLYPDNEVLSAWGSLLLGYVIVAIVFLLQPLMKSLCSKLDGTPRLLAADFFIIVSLIGTINVWRGIWNLLNIYFLPENTELSCWITLWLSLFLLILLGCSNSLLVRGVYMDAEEPGGKCVVFPCYYLRIIFEQEKIKRLAMRRMDMAGKIAENNHVFTISCKESAANMESNHKGA